MWSLLARSPHVHTSFGEENPISHWDSYCEPKNNIEDNVYQLEFYQYATATRSRTTTTTTKLQVLACMQFLILCVVN